MDDLLKKQKAELDELGKTFKGDEANAGYIKLLGVMREAHKAEIDSLEAQQNMY